MNPPSDSPALLEALEKARHSIGFCIDELQAASRLLLAPISDHVPLLECLQAASHLRQRIETIQAVHAPLHPTWNAKLTP